MDVAIDEPAPLPDDRPRAGTVRSRLMLETASELVGVGDWQPKQARIDLRPQGPGGWPIRLLASDGPDAVAEVVAGRATFAILNPATALRPALRRLGHDLGVCAAVTTIPSYDQMGFAIAAHLGIEGLEQLREAQPALRLSLRAQRNHSVHQVVEDVLAAAGMSLTDIERWGGRIRYDDGIPHRGDRLRVMRSGEVDAVFDEGIYNWTSHAADAGFRFVGLAAETRAELESWGYRSAVLRHDRYPALGDDVETIDFSGFLVYTRTDTPPDLVTAFCTALEARRDRIPWQGGPELPLESMCVDSVAAPVPVDLHPAAASFWRARGYLD